MSYNNNASKGNACCLSMKIIHYDKIKEFYGLDV